MKNIFKFFILMAILSLALFFALKFTAERKSQVEETGYTHIADFVSNNVSGSLFPLTDGNFLYFALDKNRMSERIFVANSENKKFELVNKIDVPYAVAPAHISVIGDNKFILVFRPIGLSNKEPDIIFTYNYKTNAKKQIAIANKKLKYVKIMNDKFLVAAVKNENDKIQDKIIIYDIKSQKIINAFTQKGLKIDGMNKINKDFISVIKLNTEDKNNGASNNETLIYDYRKNKLTKSKIYSSLGKRKYYLANGKAVSNVKDDIVLYDFETDNTKIFEQNSQIITSNNDVILYTKDNSYYTYDASLDKTTLIKLKKPLLRCIEDFIAIGDKSFLAIWGPFVSHYTVVSSITGNAVKIPLNSMSAPTVNDKNVILDMIVGLSNFVYDEQKETYEILPPTRLTMEDCVAYNKKSGKYLFVFNDFNYETKTEYKTLFGIMPKAKPFVFACEMGLTSMCQTSRYTGMVKRILLY